MSDMMTQAILFSAMLVNILVQGPLSRITLPYVFSTAQHGCALTFNAQQLGTCYLFVRCMWFSWFLFAALMFPRKRT